MEEPCPYLIALYKTDTVARQTRKPYKQQTPYFWEPPMATFAFPPVPQLLMPASMIFYPSTFLTSMPTWTAWNGSTST